MDGTEGVPSSLVMVNEVIAPAGDGVQRLEVTAVRSTSMILRWFPPKNEEDARFYKVRISLRSRPLNCMMTVVIDHRSISGGVQR